MNRGLNALVAMILIAGVTACDRISSRFTVTPIFEILTKQSRYVNRYVRVDGEVTKSLAVLNTSGFIIQDSTGQIAVASQTLIPKVGEKVQVRGRVQHLVTLNSTGAVVIVGD